MPEDRVEPLDRINIKKTLHGEEVDSKLDDVTDVHLSDWLNAWTLHDLLNELLIFVETQLTLFFLLVPMDPDESRLPSLYDI